MISSEAGGHGHSSNVFDLLPGGHEMACLRNMEGTGYGGMWILLWGQPGQTENRADARVLDAVNT